MQEGRESLRTECAERKIQPRKKAACLGRTSKTQSLKQGIN